MPLLDNIIEEKLLQDIIDLVSPLEAVLKPNLLNTLNPLLPILAKELYKKEFRNSIQKIKLEYYKRNLAVLELHKVPENLRLAFKIVRENLSLENISAYINFYHLYYTYKYKQLYTHRSKEFLLHESQEYDQLEIYLRFLGLDK